VISPRFRPMASESRVFAGGGPDKRMELAVLPFDGGSPELRFRLSATASPAARPKWTPDGKALSFVNRVRGVGNVWNQPLSGGPLQQLTRFTSQDIFSLDWSRDGRLAVGQGENSSDLMLLRGVREMGRVD
jgi:Tol biopolymer transport system component